MSEYNIKVYVKEGKKTGWNAGGGMDYLKGTIQYAKKSPGGNYHIENTNKEFTSYDHWIVSEDEIILLEDNEDEETIELNSKTYRKKDLEEALKHIKPIN